MKLKNNIALGISLENNYLTKVSLDTYAIRDLVEKLLEKSYPEQSFKRGLDMLLPLNVKRNKNIFQIRL